MDEKMREIEERLIRALKYPEQMQIEQDCRYLLTRIKELEREKKGMVRLTEEDMKKLGWSYA